MSASLITDGALDNVPGKVVTRHGSHTGQFWRYLNPSTPAFQPLVFDDQYLTRKGLLQGTADAGRGNTFFFDLDGQALVLRHYRRGGLIRHISSRQYLYTGLARTRAMREFDLLLHLRALELPTSAPYACQIVRGLLSYEASLITHRVPGRTLAQLFNTVKLTDLQWRQVGSTIADFHRHGIFHADLNAHNILLDSDERAYIIDFDRASVKVMSASAPDTRWCSTNIARLRRSLQKLFAQADATNSIASSHKNPHWEMGFEQLKRCWWERLMAFQE